jgi:hypothetical protein
MPQSLDDAREIRSFLLTFRRMPAPSQPGAPASLEPDPIIDDGRAAIGDALAEDMK